MSLDLNPKASSTDSFLRKLDNPQPISLLSQLGIATSHLAMAQEPTIDSNSKDETLTNQNVFHLISEHQDALFLFADMVAFTERAKKKNISSKQLITLLNSIYSGFINIVKKHPSIQVVKIAADCIMLSSSSPMMSLGDQADLMLKVGTLMSQFLDEFNRKREEPVNFRFGMDIGHAAKVRCSMPFNVSEDWVGKGVIGASLMESKGTSNRILVSKTVDKLVAPFYGETPPYLIDESTSSPKDFLTAVRVSASAPTILAPSMRVSSKTSRMSSTTSLEKQLADLKIAPEKGMVLEKVDETEDEEIFQLVSDHEKAIFLFADMQDFNKRVEKTSSTDFIALLNLIYNNFTRIIRNDPNIEIVKITPECIMLSASISSFRSDAEQAKAMVKTALKLSQFLMDLNTKDLRHDPLSFRFGLNVGAAAKVIGRLPHQKPKTDWQGIGPILASRMENSSLPNQVQITTEFYDLVKDVYECAPCTHEVKTYNKLPTYFVVRELPRKSEEYDLNQSVGYTPFLDGITLERRKSLSAPPVQFAALGTPEMPFRHFSGNNTSSPKG